MVKPCLLPLIDAVHFAHRKPGQRISDAELAHAGAGLGWPRVRRCAMLAAAAAVLPTAGNRDEQGPGQEERAEEETCQDNERKAHGKKRKEGNQELWSRLTPSTLPVLGRAATATGLNGRLQKKRARGRVFHGLTAAINRRRGQPRGSDGPDGGAGSCDPLRRRQQHRQRWPDPCPCRCPPGGR